MELRYQDKQYGGFLTIRTYSNGLYWIESIRESERGAYFRHEYAD